MSMVVTNTYVDVQNPAAVQAVIVYRQYDEDTDDWTGLSKSHVSQFGPVTKDNIEAARNYVALFRVGDSE